MTDAKVPFTLKELDLVFARVGRDGANSFREMTIQEYAARKKRAQLLKEHEEA